MAARVAQASICDIISSYVARAGTWPGHHMMPGTRQRPERRTFLGAERRRPGIGIGVEPSAVSAVTMTMVLLGKIRFAQPETKNGSRADAYTRCPRASVKSSIAARSR